MTDQIRFTDGAGYERYMGVWSRLVGRAFLEWLAPPSGGRWLDVGCGNGAFTEMIVDKCAPASVHGIDPSPAQIAFARTRPGARIADFRQGDAMALPFPDGSFDVAVMPLVIAFVPDPPKGVSEMARVVRTGGLVGAYMWDDAEGGFPYGTLMAEMRALGVAVPQPPSPDVNRIDALRALWTGAGLVDVDTRAITVQRAYANFDDYWATIRLGPSVGPPLAAMTGADLARLEARMLELLPAGPDGRVVYSARANAVKGRVVAVGEIQEVA